MNWTNSDNIEIEVPAGRTLKQEVAGKSVELLNYQVPTGQTMTVRLVINAILKPAT